ncbi:MAG TPA: RNA polymerase sigma factor SigJ [Acidimicrobiales bacterium]|nr:RNA polymerase sigma factor SigJ [Acidimicrobiales bacterium]
MADEQFFETQRPRIRGLAYRMLGSLADADDVAQETWLRWQAADQDVIARPEAWLTTVATRLALDRLRSGARRRETYPGPWLPEPLVAEPGPEEAAELADSLTLGFLVLLDQLAPVERAVFVLSDVFDVPFAEIAATVGRSEAACRQIASRARRRLRPEKPPARNAASERSLLDGLIGAVAAGDIDAVLAHLAPDVVLLSDGGPHRRAARRPVVGPYRVSRLLVNLAHRIADRLEIRPATVNGAPGVLLYIDGRLDQVLAVESHDGGISAIHVVRNPEKLSDLGHPVRLE